MSIQEAFDTAEAQAKITELKMRLAERDRQIVDLHRANNELLQRARAAEQRIVNALIALRSSVL